MNVNDTGAIEMHVVTDVLRTATSLLFWKRPNRPNQFGRTEIQRDFTEYS